MWRYDVKIKVKHKRKNEFTWTQATVSYQVENNNMKVYSPSTNVQILNNDVFIFDLRYIYVWTGQHNREILISFYLFSSSFNTKMPCDTMFSMMINMDIVLSPNKLWIIDPMVTFLWLTISFQFDLKIEKGKHFIMLHIMCQKHVDTKLLCAYCLIYLCMNISNIHILFIRWYSP